MSEDKISKYRALAIISLCYLYLNNKTNKIEWVNSLLIIWKENNESNNYEG